MACMLVYFTIMLLTIILSTPSTCNASTDPKYTAIFVFGDSTADTGINNFMPTIFQSNHAPYGRNFPGGTPTGRFSDGRLVPDMLASALGIKELVPPYLYPNLSGDELRTGVSFASAGSGLDDLTTALSGVIPVSKQPRYFQWYIGRLENVVGEEEAAKIVNGSLAFISAGSNDLLFDYYATPARRIQFNMSGYQDFLQQKLREIVKEIYDFGCRSFVIIGLGPIGCVPLEITARLQDPNSRKCLDDVNSDAQLYNAKLQNLIPAIQASLPGSKLHYVDAYKTTMDIINNAQQYGFRHTTKGCCGTGLKEVGPFCNALSIVCANASEYLFWDAVHPSEAAYRLVVQSIIEKIFS